MQATKPKCVFLPGTWCNPNYQLHLVQLLNKTGLMECTLVYEKQEETLSNLSEDTIIIAHSFGAYVACEKYKGLNRRILWNPVGLFTHLNRLGWWWGLVFKWRLIGHLLRLLHVEWAYDHRTRSIECEVSNCIYLSATKCFWFRPVSVDPFPVHIVYSGNDSIIPLNSKLASSYLIHAYHDIQEEDWLCTITSIVKENSFSIKKHDDFDTMVMTTPWLTKYKVM